MSFGATKVDLVLQYALLLAAARNRGRTTFSGEPKLKMKCKMWPVPYFVPKKPLQCSQQPTTESTDMAILTIDIPDDVKDRCEKIFVGQAIEEMLARLLREALEQETMRRRAEAVDRLLARRAATKPASAEEVQATRLAGRP